MKTEKEIIQEVIKYAKLVQLNSDRIATAQEGEDVTEFESKFCEYSEKLKTLCWLFQ